MMQSGITYKKEVKIKRVIIFTKQPHGTGNRLCINMFIKFSSQNNIYY